MKPPALFLHGGPGLSDYLDSLEAELDGIFEVERYEQDHRQRSVPEFVAEARSHLSSPKWLVGHSWGGLLAFHTASAAPADVLGVIAIGSLGVIGMGGWDEVGEPMLARLTPDERARLEDAQGPERLEIVWPAYFSRRERVPPFPAMRVYPETLEAVYEWLTEHADDPATIGELSTFDKPTLILHGAEDAIPVAAVVDTAELIPGAELLVFDDVAHFPWLERPGIVREAIAGFVAGDRGVDFHDRRSS